MGTNTENSVEVLTVFQITDSLIWFCLFKFKVIADQPFYSHKFYLYQNVYIYIYMYTFALN